MKYCKNCEINYEVPLEKCLICHNNLEDVENTKVEEYKFPVYKKEKDTNKLIIRISNLINIISIITCLFIDYSYDKHISWSLISLLSNVFLMLLMIIVLSKLRTSFKIANLTILSIILVVSIGLILDDYHWALDIFLPFALIANTIIIKVIIFSRPKKWRDYLSLLFISIILNLSIILLNLFGISITKWAITTSFFYGVITLIAFIIFTPRDLKEEIKRRFHI